MEHPFFMNGAGNTPRAEAIRWLSIAEKLLTNRDLVGSKSFATRARESDPTLLPADQILAIVDTLIAGDKRINSQHVDYYAILQIPTTQTNDTELIANQYRRLALLLNPQKNTYPYATHAFRLVLDAWSVLSNAFRRSVYDKEIGFFVNLNPVVVTSPPPSNHNTNSNNNPPIGFMQHQQQQPSSSVIFPQSHHPVSSSSRTVSFLGINQTQQPVVSSTMLSPEREQRQPFTFGSSSTSTSTQRQQQQQQQQVASVEQQVPSRNEGFVGNIQYNHSTSTTRNSNVNNEGLFGNNQNHSATTRNDNVNNEGLFGNNQNRSASTSKNVNFEGLFGNDQTPSVSANNNNVNNEGLVGNNQNRSASTSNKNVQQGKQGGVDASSTSRAEVPSFWTACPYCYVMYEYALEYLDCTLRCQKCKRAFQALKIASPPPIIEGKEAYFCCWGFMPLGFSMENFKKYKGNISSWTPFSPIKHGGVTKPAAPRVYIDDIEDDVFLGLSESSEESDEDWRSDKMKKKAKSGKQKSRRGRKKKVKIDLSDKGKNVEVNAGDNVPDVSATQGGAEMPNVTTSQSIKRGVASNTRRQAGRVAKDVGKLDLNVEFSNEVEEPPAPGMGQGNGAGTGEDGPIEGIEFFEGLDEFLSSLPILNAVGDDKVKAA